MQAAGFRTAREADARCTRGEAATDKAFPACVHTAHIATGALRHHFSFQEMSKCYQKTALQNCILAGTREDEACGLAEQRGGSDCICSARKHGSPLADTGSPLADTVSRVMAVQICNQELTEIHDEVKNNGPTFNN